MKPSANSYSLCYDSSVRRALDVDSHGFESQLILYWADTHLLCYWDDIHVKLTASDISIYVIQIDLSVM